MAAGMEKPVLGIQNSIAHIRFQGDAGNAAFHNLQALEEMLFQIDSRTDLIGVVFSGLGGHATAGSREAMRDLLAAGFESLLDAIEEIAIPTLGVLEGEVCGAALDLALCCDIRIGVRGARAALPSAALGIHHHPGGLRRLVARVGQSAAMKLLLAGHTMEDEEMLRTGLVNELVAGHERESRLDRHAAALADCNATVVRGMKRHILQSGRIGFDEAGARHAHLLSLR